MRGGGEAISIWGEAECKSSNDKQNHLCTGVCGLVGGATLIFGAPVIGLYSLLPLVYRFCVRSAERYFTMES